jgi:hypothetical protein
MGIFREFINSRKKKKETLEEKKFNALSVEQKKEVCDKVLQLNGNGIENMISKKPYILPYIIADVKVEEVERLVDIATKKGVSVYDLIDKNNRFANSAILNIAAKNQPELILELDDMPALQDLITSDTLIEAFTKNPEVLFSNCKALESSIKTFGTKRDGTEGVRYTKLKTQLQRAMNLYFRPESYSSNGFDDFAWSIAGRIDDNTFGQKVASNKMTTRSTTAANETLKQDPNKGAVVPAKTLHNWNNRVLHTLPNEVRKKLRKSKVNYSEFQKYIIGLLKNPSLNSFSDKEKTKLAKKCVSILPEVYFELSKIAAFEDTAKELTVQLTAYETFKKQKKDVEALKLLGTLSEKEVKKLEARVKANKTRKANKTKKKATKAEDQTL